MATETVVDHQDINAKIEHAHTDQEHAAVEDWDGGDSPFKVSYGKLMMWYFLLSDAFTFAGFLIAYGTLRFSMPSWPVPDFVFQAFPGGIHEKPLMFVSLMTFILIISSVTMVRAVQEGHRDNIKGVVFWMLLTILGGVSFLGCQAWEWTTLIGTEHVSVSRNPFGTYKEGGVYLTDQEGKPYANGAQAEKFKKGAGYLVEAEVNKETGEAEKDESGNLKFFQRPYKTDSGKEMVQQFGPTAFGALFFFITGFHGFHVLSGVAFLAIIMLNAASGLYKSRGNHHEMIEKIGLYWHFVDLVWVFVFLVFYLL